MREAIKDEEVDGSRWTRTEIDGNMEVGIRLLSMQIRLEWVTSRPLKEDKVAR